jgi:hypothetical protein
MTKPIDRIELHQLTPTLKSLAKAGGTTNHADWIRSGGNAALLIGFINGQLALSEKNVFEMTVEDQLAALRLANDEEKWGIAEEDFTRLAATVPAWPKGKHAYRSLRIRFGEGDEGVTNTFERHVARIRSVFTEASFWCWEYLHSAPKPYAGENSELKKRFGDKPVERLRLLSGNNAHKAVIEWVIVDLDANRKRKSVTAVRGPQSLADELLVVAWMFPDMIRAIDYDELPGLFAGGYELNVPECGHEAWQRVVFVYFARGRRQVRVDAGDRSRGYSDCSVPVLRE